MKHEAIQARVDHSLIIYERISGYLKEVPKQPKNFPEGPKLYRPHRVTRIPRVPVGQKSIMNRLVEVASVYILLEKRIINLKKYTNGSINMNMLLTKYYFDTC